MGESGEEKVFWLDSFQGKPEKNYPFRSDLKETIEKVESTTDQKVVGIVYDETYTIQILTTKKDKE
jgi:hypothetical protein